MAPPNARLISRSNAEPSANQRHHENPSTTGSIKLLPPLLTLPGEIRNRIYGYALSVETALVYLVGSSGIGKFCTELPKHYFTREKVETKHLRSRTLYSTIAQLNVTTPEEIDALPSWNQLQYVSRQVRRETRGMHLLWNELTFPGTSTRMHISQLFQFLQCFPTSKLKYLRVINARPTWQALGAYYPIDATGDEDNWKRLCEICRSNPELLIRIRVPNCQGSDDESRDVGSTEMHFYCFLRVLLRDDWMPFNMIKEQSFSKISRETARIHWARSLSRLLHTESFTSMVPLPTNLRIMPSERLGDADTYPSGWYELAREFVQDGI